MKWTTLFSFLFILVSFLYAQTGKSPVNASLPVPDSLTTDSLTLDSLTTDSLKSDSLQKNKNTLQGPVKYSADFISLADSGNVIILIGHAKLKYMDMQLTAAYIRLNQRKKTLFAKGLPDSVAPDGTPVITGKPVFTEKGQEPMIGDQIEYNFSTKRGKITMGKTKMEPGFYRGEQINRIADSTLLVRNGIFTSCEYIDHPHYYFKSNRIRIKIKDKIVARPVTFYIADIPLAWFPFAIFPNKRGRHSGIVIPKYGEGATTGKFLRGFGYYWAPNDYFDASFLMDFYDRIGLAYRTNMRYRVRYKLNGRFNAEYFPRDPVSGRHVERWRFRFEHRQIIEPGWNISGNGSFSSDKQFARQLSPNMNDRLNQNITSHLTINKRWGQKSLTISASHNQNLQTGSSSYTAPTVSFSYPTKSLYELITGEKVGAERSWYKNIQFQYSSQFIHKGSKTVLNDSTVRRAQSQGARHRFSFRAPMRIFKYFNFNPSLSINEDWVDQIATAKYDSVTKKILISKKRQFAARHTFSSSFQLRTTLYGLFEPNIGPLKFIRHKLDPVISFNYTPDFSSPFYGYFTRIDTNGTLVKVDKFKYSPYGSTPTSRSQNVSISLSNLFQGKLIDKEGKEKKINLLTANFSTSYNFLAEKYKWSNISGRFQTTVFGKSISFNTTHTFYKIGKDNRLLNKMNYWPTLLTLYTTFNFRITEKTFQKKKKSEEKSPSDSVNVHRKDEGILKTEYQDMNEDEYMTQAKKVKLPWSLSFNFTYNYNRLADPKDRHRIGFNSNASIQLTKNWKISWSAVFDIKNRKIASQNFSIYRDLHCWEMSFNWQPEIGYYFFQINIKASALHDIKLTKRPTRNVRYSGYY